MPLILLATVCNLQLSQYAMLKKKTDHRLKMWCLSHTKDQEPNVKNTHENDNTIVNKHTKNAKGYEQRIHRKGNSYIQ